MQIARVSQRLQWESLRRRQSSKDVSGDWSRDLTTRREILALPDLLCRAQQRYRRLHKTTGKNPFCVRCTRSLKRRRFADLCTRCLTGLRGEGSPTR